MMHKFLLTRRSMLYSLVGMLLTAMLTLWGCGSGGSGSYSSPPPPPVPVTTKAPAILDGAEGVATLQQWIDEGRLNAPFATKSSLSEDEQKVLSLQNDRVVIVSPSTPADWTTKGHIPGAVRWGTDETAISRMEGPGFATNMMPTGSFMDGVIQRLGIDGNTTIVISLPTGSANIYSQSLVYWNLRYWGFPRERIKILNGGDDLWVAEGKTLSTSAIEKYTASTYSVKNNKKLNATFRVSLGEMITKIDEITANPALKDTWQMVDVRGFKTDPFLKHSQLQSGAQQFLSRLNDDNTKNFVYPDKATLLEKLSTLAVKDDGADAFLSPNKKTIAMCGTSTSASPTFVLFDAVLGVPEGNIALYDGSASQWGNYSKERLEAAYPDLSAGVISSWALNDRIGGTKTLAVTPVSDYFLLGYKAVLPSSSALMNQILLEDEAYMKSGASSDSGSSSSGGGSAPSGC